MFLMMAQLMANMGPLLWRRLLGTGLTVPYCSCGEFVTLFSPLVTYLRKEQCLRLIKSKVRRGAFVK